MDFEPSMSRSVSTHFANAAQHDSGFANSSSDSSSRFQFSSQFKSSEFKSSHKDQQTMGQRISSLTYYCNIPLFEAYSKFDQSQISGKPISLGTFYKYTGKQFKKAHRFSDLCDYCEKYKVCLFEDFLKLNFCIYSTVQMISLFNSFTCHNTAKKTTKTKPYFTKTYFCFCCVLFSFVWNTNLIMFHCQSFRLYLISF